MVLNFVVIVDPMRSVVTVTMCRANIVAVFMSSPFVGCDCDVDLCIGKVFSWYGQLLVFSVLPVQVM